MNKDFFIHRLATDKTQTSKIIELENPFSPALTDICLSNLSSWVGELLFLAIPLFLHSFSSEIHCNVFFCKTTPYNGQTVQCYTGWPLMVNSSRVCTFTKPREGLRFKVPTSHSSFSSVDMPDGWNNNCTKILIYSHAKAKSIFFSN